MLGIALRNIGVGDATVAAIIESYSVRESILWRCGSLRGKIGERGSPWGTITGGWVSWTALPSRRVVIVLESCSYIAWFNQRRASTSVVRNPRLNWALWDSEVRSESWAWYIFPRKTLILLSIGSPWLVCIEFEFSYSPATVVHHCFVLISRRKGTFRFSIKVSHATCLVGNSPTSRNCWRLWASESSVAG